MKFDYYYGSQADQFSFIRIPKAMLIEKTFSSLSLQAKMLYGVLLDRMGLSMKNGWFDSENKVYIIYQIAEIQEDLGFSKKKAIDYLSELETFGLVEKKRRGLGLPSILYVKSFLVQKDCVRKPVEKVIETSRGSDSDTSEKLEIAKIEDTVAETTEEIIAAGEEKEDVVKQEQKFYEPSENLPRSADLGTSRSVDFDTSRSVDLGTSRSADLTPQEVSKWAPLINNTKENDIEESNNKSNHILSGVARRVPTGYDCDMISEMDAYEQIIKENIAYDDLLVSYPYETETIEGIKQLILETVLNKNETMVIASNTYPVALVKSKFLKLNYSHIEYVMDCFKANTSKVKNIKKYLLAALFNAPSTMDSYYRAEVNHDMPYMFMAGMEA